MKLPKSVILSLLTAGLIFSISSSSFALQTFNFSGQGHSQVTYFDADYIEYSEFGVTGTLHMTDEAFGNVLSGRSVFNGITDFVLNFGGKTVYYGSGTEYNMYPNEVISAIGEGFLVDKGYYVGRVNLLMDGTFRGDYEHYAFKMSNDNLYEYQSQYLSASRSAYFTGNWIWEYWDEPAPAPVPEPSSFLLTGVGLFGLGLYGRRSRKLQQA